VGNKLAKKGEVGREMQGEGDREEGGQAHLMRAAKAARDSHGSDPMAKVPRGEGHREV
jgi:hypothetical protein